MEGGWGTDLHRVALVDNKIRHPKIVPVLPVKPRLLDKIFGGSHCHHKGRKSENCSSPHDVRREWLENDIGPKGRVTACGGPGEEEAGGRCRWASNTMSTQGGMRTPRGGWAGTRVMVGADKGTASEATAGGWEIQMGQVEAINGRRQSSPQQPEGFVGPPAQNQGFPQPWLTAARCWC